MPVDLTEDNDNELIRQYKAEAKKKKKVTVQVIKDDAGDLEKEGVGIKKVERKQKNIGLMKLPT